MVPHVQFQNQFAKILQNNSAINCVKNCVEILQKFSNGIFCKTFCTSNHVKRPLLSQFQAKWEKPRLASPLDKLIFVLEKKNETCGYISYVIKKVRNSQLLIFEKNGLVWPADIWLAHLLVDLTAQPTSMKFYAGRIKPAGKFE